jgi:hypothetical protein
MKILTFRNKISIIRLIIEYIFIVNFIRDINANTIYYNNFVKII